MIEINHPNLNISKQSSMLELSRGNIYYQSTIIDDSDLANQIHELYLKSRCIYGYRKVTAALAAIGIIVNHKKVMKIMRRMNIKGLYPKKRINTTISNSNHKFPYLLKDLIISRPNQVWATDITYIWLPIGFIYLVAIIDLYSRYIIAHMVSISLEAEFCIETLNCALKAGVKPEIFNSDQGVQFTSNQFIKILTQEQIRISMDGKGRCFDNIFMERFWRTAKQEDVYYKKYQNVTEAKESIGEFIIWYNYERLHQAIGYKTPYQLYAKGKVD
jgi:putative transposase